MFSQRLHPLTASGALAAAILIAYLAQEITKPDLPPVAKLFAVLIVLSTISVMLLFIGVIRQNVRASVLREAQRDTVKASQHKAHVEAAVARGVKTVKDALPAMVTEAVTQALGQPSTWCAQMVEDISTAVVRRATDGGVVPQHAGGDVAARLAALEGDRPAGRVGTAGSMHAGAGADDMSYAADDLLDAELRGYLQRKADDGELDA